MNKLIKKSNDVYQALGSIINIGQSEVAFLKAQLPFSSKGRVRINLHPSSNDLLHEMFIAISAHSYIRPHKHPMKSESFHIIYGEVDIVLFEDDGKIREVISLAHRKNGASFFYRISEPIFHTLVVKSEFVVLHEITNGPFNEGEAIFGTFAPDEIDEVKIEIWKISLKNKLKDKL